MRKLWLTALIAVVMALPARAATVTNSYSLSAGAFGAANCPSGDCGTIVVTGDTDNALDTSVTMVPTVALVGLRFDMGGDFTSFALAPESTASYQTPTTGVYAGFGGHLFQHNIACNFTSCTDPLNFTASGGPFDLLAILFSATIHLPSGLEGMVGSNLISSIVTEPPLTTPLPGALLLLGSVLGLGGAGAWLRKRVTIGKCDRDDYYRECARLIARAS